MPDLISIDSVEHLESYAFTGVLNALLTAEADYRNVSLTDVDLTLRTTDPDAGIDGHIRWPDAVKHDVLTAGENVVQYKSGEITPARLETEFGKPGVQAALSRNGHYVLFVGRAYVKSGREARAARLRSLYLGHYVLPQDFPRIAAQFSMATKSLAGFRGSRRFSFDRNWAWATPLSSRQNSGSSRRISQILLNLTKLA
jgi:hypothetical protein